MTSDRSFHRIYNADDSLAISLNASLVWLFVMLMGRSNLGEGALKFEKSDALKLMVLDLSGKATLKPKEFKLFKRPPLDILSEIGFDKNYPIRDQVPNPLPDRKALDDLIFDELEFTEEERKEVYWATAELVKQRLDKAGSR